MTAPLTPCQRCHEGILVHRPGEPLPRCGQCGAPEACPLVAGGQGRSAEEVVDSAGIAGACFAALALLVCVAGLAALVAGWLS